MSTMNRELEDLIRRLWATYHRVAALNNDLRVSLTLLERTGGQDDRQAEQVAAAAVRLDQAAQALEASRGLGRFDAELAWISGHVGTIEPGPGSFAGVAALIGESAAALGEMTARAMPGPETARLVHRALCRIADELQLLSGLVKKG